MDHRGFGADLRIENWGDGYFAINAEGHVCVRPSSDKAVEIDLYEIAGSLKDKHLSLPVLVRFTDILKDRVKRLQAAFQKACVNNDYQAAIRPSIRSRSTSSAKSSKAFWLPTISAWKRAASPNCWPSWRCRRKSVVICNGYKDRAYIRLALIGLKMGLNLYLVIEKPSELELIIEEAARTEHQAAIGRARAAGQHQRRQMAEQRR